MGLAVGAPARGAGGAGERGAAPSPRLPPSELREKSGKSVGESRAASGEGPGERLAGGGGEHPSSLLWLPGACASCRGGGGGLRERQKRWWGEQGRKAFSFSTAFFPFFATSLELLALPPWAHAIPRFPTSASLGWDVHRPPSLDLGRIQNHQTLRAAFRGHGHVVPPLDIWCLDAQRAKPAPLQLTAPVIQGGMLGAGMPAGQQSILPFPRSTERFPAPLAPGLKLLFVPEAKAVAFSFAR